MKSYFYMVSLIAKAYIYKYSYCIYHLQILLKQHEIHSRRFRTLIWAILSSYLCQCKPNGLHEMSNG